MKKDIETIRLTLPDGITRMETGPVKFGDDWTGIFLRGDTACPMAFYLQDLCKAYREGVKPAGITLTLVENFAKMLLECREEN